MYIYTCMCIYIYTYVSSRHIEQLHCWTQTQTQENIVSGIKSWIVYPQGTYHHY